MTPNINPIRNKYITPASRDSKTDKFYSSSAWRKLRARKLRTDPLCEVCNRLVQATVVDHHIPRRFREDLSLSFDNLTSMCTRCHAQKSQLEGKCDSIGAWEEVINQSKFKKP